VGEADVEDDAREGVRDGRVKDGVGLLVGDSVGNWVVDCMGDFVGVSLGDALGTLLVGDSVGDWVGACMGACVGDFVCDGYRPCPAHQAKQQSFTVNMSSHMCPFLCL